MSFPKYFSSILVLFIIGCGSSDHSLNGSVLVIGDSISIGYFPYLQIGEMTISHSVNPDGDLNANGSNFGVNAISYWLKDFYYDAILFNFGLHDFRKADASEITPIDEYKRNLLLIGADVKEHCDHPFFILTTDAPAYDPLLPDPYLPMLYNAAAIQAMKDLDIPTIDLLTISKMISWLHIDADQKTNVHYTNAGYEILGAFLSDDISNLLLKSASNAD